MKGVETFAFAHPGCVGTLIIVRCLVLFVSSSTSLPFSTTFLALSAIGVGISSNILALWSL